MEWPQRAKVNLAHLDPRDVRAAKLLSPRDSPTKPRDAFTSTVAGNRSPSRDVEDSDVFLRTVDFDTKLNQSRTQSKLGKQPIINYVLEKVNVEINKPEWQFYRAANGRYKQVYELIGENKNLRELAKKISTHFNHQIEKSRLKDLHEERRRAVQSKYGSKKSTEDEQMAGRIKVNEK